MLGSNSGEAKTTGSQTALSSSIPQVNGLDDNNEVDFTFNQASRVQVCSLSADDMCRVVLHPVQAQALSCPAMDPVNTEVCTAIKIMQKLGFHPIYMYGCVYYYCVVYLLTLLHTSTH